MVPGGSGVARRRPLVALLLLGALAVPFLHIPTAAAEPSYEGGDAGTGLPPVEVDAPRTSAATSVRWADVTSSHGWARTAIDFVAGERKWMRDFRPDENGVYPFRPDALTKRKHFARAVVRAFASKALPDDGLRFPDLDRSSGFWASANVAVSKGWITTRGGGAFRPNDPVTMKEVHRALVLARGLRPAVRALNAIHTADGTRLKAPSAFGTNVLGMRLGLRYPSKYQDHDVHPWTPMPRIQVAYSLHRAAIASSGTVAWLAGQYAEVELPRMSDARRKIVAWGVKYAGYPYVWGGEWGLRSPNPLGGQTIPGFDCSGFVWWLAKKNDGFSWKVAPPRPYRGWGLPERTSATMAGATSKRLRYEDLKPGDLMFYDGDRNGTVDHVDLYVGNGWALDSSNTPAGVTLMWVGDGWYRDHFKFGRRITR